jgi:urease accessory protein
MWCEKVRGNLAELIDSTTSELDIDFVELAWHQCGQIVKTQTTTGEPIRILLSRGQRLRHGDVVYQDERRLVVIKVTPCEVIVAYVPRAEDAAILALELGNLHLPAQIGDGEILFIEDVCAVKVLEFRSMPWKREIRRFEPSHVLSAPVIQRADDLRIIRGRPDRDDQEGATESVRSSFISASQAALTD